MIQLTQRVCSEGHNAATLLWDDTMQTVEEAIRPGKVDDPEGWVNSMCSKCGRTLYVVTFSTNVHDLELAAAMLKELHPEGRVVGDKVRTDRSIHEILADLVPPF